MIGWIAFVIGLICAINNYNTIKAKYDDFMSNGPWIKIINVYADGNEELKYNKIKYLYFDFKIYSAQTLDQDLKVKIIDPWGTVSRRKESPKGYSFTVYGYRRTPFCIYSTGWGSDYVGTYARGKYKIEFWYRDQCVGSRVVDIK